VEEENLEKSRFCSPMKTISPGSITVLPAVLADTAGQKIHAAITAAISKNNSDFFITD
jgi:hypothetical protein